MAGTVHGEGCQESVFLFDGDPFSGPASFSVSGPADPRKLRGSSAEAPRKLDPCLVTIVASRAPRTTFAKHFGEPPLQEGPHLPW